MNSYLNPPRKLIASIVLASCLFAGSHSSLAISPPVAITQEATDLNLTGSSLSATLNGIVILGDPATTAFFEWGIGDHFGNIAGQVGFPGGTGAIPLSFPLTGLSPGVPYQFRLVADNAMGRSWGVTRRIWAWEPEMTLNGPDPLIHVACPFFEDPGVTVSASPMAIAGGWGVSLALRADSSVFGWTSYGPITIPAAATEVVAVSAGQAFRLALKADGSVIGWGSNSEGQTTIPAAATDVMAISAGAEHALAVKDDGSVIGWGQNNFEQITIPPDATGVVAVAAGTHHSLALKSNGTVIGWGNDTFGQSSIPPEAGTRVLAIVATERHSMVLRIDGSVFGWGYNNEYVLTIPPEATSHVVAIAGSETHALALKDDGSVIGWGCNDYGEVTIPAAATDVVAIAAGENHSMALKADGSVIGWGSTGSTAPGEVNALDVEVSVDGTVDPVTPGDYLLTYNFTNEFGASASAQRTVRVIDVPPELTLLGDNPLIHDCGTPFSDPGATATDQCGGSLTASIEVGGTVDVNRPGTYILSYVVTDQNGHTSQTTRTVRVMTVPSMTAGDLDGDGVVTQDEFDQVVHNYFGSQSRPSITNLLTDDQGRCQMTLLNSDSWSFSAEVSIDLQSWTPLGSVRPYLEFLDPEAGEEPQRFYRLTWP